MEANCFIWDNSFSESLIFIILMHHLATAYARIVLNDRGAVFVLKYVLLFLFCPLEEGHSTVHMFYRSNRQKFKESIRSYLSSLFSPSFVFYEILRLYLVNLGAG
jgi:hypothetical protein